MRLTLRYLLAYMDDQLEPADAQQVAAMIEASPFATELMHRLRDVSRRLKLGAPKVDSRGLAADANSVAEYLDHTMSPEQVAEFEKLCLASEVHLAEVTSAHQILALVLGERAEVDPQMRRRMYALPQRAEAEAEAPAESAEDEAVTVAPARKGKSRRRRPEIPEWLRDQPRPKNNWLSLGVAAVLLIGVGGGVAWYYFAHLPAQVVVAQNGGAASDAANGATGDAGAARPAAEGVAATAEGNTAAEERETSIAVIEDAAAAAAAVQESTAGAAGVSAPAESAAAAPAVVEGAPEEAAALAPSRVEPTPIEATPAPADAAPGGAVPVPGNIAAASPSGGSLDDPFNTDVPQSAPPARVNALDDQALVPGRQPSADGSEPPESAAEVVGRLVNDNDILLRIGPDRVWRRLSMRDAILAGDELMAVPTFRPSLSLRTGDGATAHMLGGSLIRILAPDANAVPGLDVVDGQVVVTTAGKPGTPLNLRIGNAVYHMTFTTPDATMAIDVRHTLPDGADPTTTPAKTSVDLYVPSGEVEYTNDAGEAHTATAPAFVRLSTADAAGDAAFSTENTFPAWINGNPLSHFEKLAADFVEKELIRDEPVEQTLHELADSRRIEARDLAVHTLTLLGDFRGLLPLLSDTRYRSNWAGQIEVVRRALARDPQLAVRLQKTLETQCDAKKAQNVYEMLLGFSARQLQEGAAAQLVADLDSDDLDVRVLAFWNLQRVSVGTQGYRPDFEATKRRASVKAWRDKLEKGQIVPRNAP